MKEKINVSIFLTAVIIIILTTISFNYDLFIGYDDIKYDLTNNYAIDKEIVRNAGETNFTIVMFLGLICAGVSVIIYKISRFIEIKIKTFIR